MWVIPSSWYNTAVLPWGSSGVWASLQSSKANPLSIDHIVMIDICLWLHDKALKRGVNPNFLKFIDRYNFWILTVTYIKVYNFGKVMSCRIHFCYQISLKMLTFWENRKKKTPFFGSNFLWQANKNSFELKMFKLLEHHDTCLETFFLSCFVFCFFTNILFYKFLIKKSAKIVIFLKKIKFWRSFLCAVEPSTRTSRKLLCTTECSARCNVRRDGRVSLAVC